MKAESEVKLFLTFFIICFLFVHWVGANEQTRIFQAIEIANKNTFEITDYANLTVDRINLNGKYYSDKAPGTSFALALPLLLSQKLTGSIYLPHKDSLFIPQEQFNTTVYLDVVEEPSIQLARIFGILLLSTLPGSLIVLMIYRITFKLFLDKKIALLSAVAFGFGTIIFNFSSVLFGNIFGLLLVLIAFYLLFLSKKFRNNILAGVLLGLAFFFDYTSIIASLLILFFFLFRKQSEKSEAILGFVIGILPLFLYNYMIFHHPFSFTFDKPDPSIFPCAYGTKYYSGCKKIIYKAVEDINKLAAFILVGLLFYPYRGVIVYSPFLIFSFIGFFYFFRKFKNLALLSLLIFIFYLLFNASYTLWWGGSSFGARYLMFSIPFLSLPFAYYLKIIFTKLKRNKSKLMLFLLLLTISISIFHMFLGNSGYWEGIDVKYRNNTLENYVYWYGGKKKTKGPVSLLNPLYQHYLPAFLQNGPRSRILEQGIIGKLPDIRDFQPMPMRKIKMFSLYPLGFLILSTPFLTLFIVLALVALIWLKELKEHKKLYFLLLASLFILFLSKLSFSQIVYGKEFYPLVGNETLRWFGNQGTIYIFSNTSGKHFLNISLVASRLKASKSLNIYLNGKLIGKFYGDKVFQEVYLEKGENVLRLKSNECEIPLKINKTYRDPRCLSFGIKKLEIIRKKLPKNKIIFGSNFYESEILNKTNLTQRWSSANSTIFIFSDSYKEVFLNLTLSPYKIRKIKLEINNKPIGEYYQPSNILEKIKLKRGLNKIQFFSSCNVPALVENSSDYRCLSFLIKHINLVDISFVKTHAKFFGSNWYDWEQINGKKFRWASSNASIYLFSKKKEPIKVNITLAPYKEGKLIVIANGKPIINTYLKEKQTILSKTFEAKEGINKIVLESKCKIPFVIEKTTDMRCLAFALYNFSIVKLREIPNGTIFYNNKFYGEENFDNTKFRWLSDNGEISVISSIPGKLSFLAWTPPSFDTTLKLKAGKIFSNSYEINPTMQKVETPFFIPKNEIVFKASSERGCTFYKNDSRCLSIAFGNVSFLPLNIENIEARGFYGLEKDGWGRNFRWINDSASLEFFSLGNFSKSLKIKMGASYFKPRTLQVYWNNKLVQQKLISKETDISLSLSIKKGKNTLLLKSKEGCDIPALKEGTSDKRCLSFMILNMSFE